MRCCKRRDLQKYKYIGIVIERLMNVLELRTLSALTRGLFWCLEINTKISLEWTQQQYVTRVHKLFLFLTRHEKSIKRHSLRIVPVSHSLGFRSADDDVTIDCWWRHYSLNIDLIHGDIHGRSCKKWTSPLLNILTQSILDIRYNKRQNILETDKSVKNVFRHNLVWSTYASVIVE